MSYQTLKLRRDGRVLYVDFDNPPLNLITIQMVGELFELGGSLVFDQETSVVVLGSANPEFFVAHFDLNDMFRSMNDPDLPQSKYDDVNVLQALTTMWQTLPQTTVAVVDGIVRGGGLEFILAFDMRFTTPGSRFCFPETTGGFLPTGGGTTRLAMQVGPARATEILLSARDFSGAEAASYGLVNRCLGAEELTAYVKELTDSVARRPRAAVAAVTEVFRTVFNSTVDAQFAGFAAENAAMKTLLSQPEVIAHLTRMAEIQDVEHERDLPASIAASGSSPVAG